MMNQRYLPRPGRRPVVVGVDGSPGSKVALRWALDHAGRTSAGVEAIIVWTQESTFAFGYEWASTAVAGVDLAAAADTVLLDTLVEVVGEHCGPVVIQPRVIQGRPAEELLRAARSAELLVLGGPTHGRVSGLLTGSVSHQCVQRACCPVVITPTPAGHARGASPSHPAEGMTL